MDKALFQQLNRIYAPLHSRALRLTQALAQRGIKAEWGWYNNHSVRVDGEYQTEEFPIPVVDVGGLCEIGLDSDGCWLEFRLPREAALAFDWGRLAEGLEVYGVDDYLLDFYRAGMDIAGIAGRIEASAEQAVNAALYFPADVEDQVLLAAVEDCRRRKDSNKA
ncbi:MAG: DUF3201 domain-containing protein [Oscillospiraceae bacterium]|nr:DUF3201 domain-containing protein [Oscillospiraceae bacterium]